MNTRLRSLVLPSAFAALLAPVLHASTAHAACSTTDPQCSFGKVEGLSASYNQAPTDGVIGFNWEQQLFGGNNFAIGVGANLRMTQRSEEGRPLPFFSVDLSTADKAPVVEAYWTDDKTVRVRFLDAVDKFATFEARHGLAVELSASARAFNNQWDRTWDVTDDITFGSNPFEFDAQASQSFAPWAAAAPFQMAVVGGSVDSSQLFDVQLDQIGLPRNWATGRIGVYVSTEGTIFNYKTSAAKFNGTLAQIGGDISLPPAAEYGDELTLRTVVTGSVWVQGKLFAKPFVQMMSIYQWGHNSVPEATSGTGGINWPLEYAAPSLSIVKDFRIPADASKTLDVEFPETTLLIPIPNVKADKTAVAMSGRSGRFLLTNTGKKAARIRIQADNNAFQVPGGEQEISPGGTLDVQVVYGANDPANAQLTVFTNDPDSPQIAINVGANGAPVREPNQDDPDRTGSSGSSGRGGIAGADDETSGCGCRTSGTTGEQAGGLALLIAGVITALRRGRRARG